MIQIQDNEREFQKLLSMWSKIEDGHDEGKVSDDIYNAFMNTYIKEEHSHEWVRNDTEADISAYCKSCKETYRE